MKNFFSSNFNMGFLIPGIVFFAVYFVDKQIVWLILGMTFIALSGVIKPKSKINLKKLLYLTIPQIPKIPASPGL
jgi:hypothetical protein